MTLVEFQSRVEYNLILMPTLFPTEICAPSVYGYYLGLLVHAIIYP